MLEIRRSLAEPMLLGKATQSYIHFRDHRSQVPDKES